jgi:hypothetical protein
MSAAATSTMVAVRPSSLPLPKTLTHSCPADRLSIPRKRGMTPPLREGSAEIMQGLYRETLQMGLRRKISSTSSGSTGSNTPTSPYVDQRQVKSLTPDRDALIAAKAVPSIRKASSSRGLNSAARSNNRANAENEAKSANVNHNKTANANNNNNNNKMNGAAKSPTGNAKTKGTQTNLKNIAVRDCLAKFPNVK